jgi:MFS transporter, FHS family, L-fucose permease
MEKHKMTSKENMIPFILVTALFFMWGIPNNLNDVLIKQFMKSFEITRFEAGLIQSAFYMGYFLLSMPAALIMRRFSYKTGLVTGLLLFSLGAFLFYPAALIGKFWFFQFALFVIASGLAFLETGANPFIAVLGDPESSAQRLNFSQAFNPIGAITGAAIGTIFIFSGIELSDHAIAVMKQKGIYEHYLKIETMRVVAPYICLGLLTLFWAMLIARTKFPKVNEENHGKADNIGKGGIRELLRYPHFILGVVAQFFYVGAQVGTWSYYIQYVQDYTGQPEKVAGSFLIGTLVAFGVGRFLSAYLMRYIKPNLLMGCFGIANVILVSIGIAYPGWVGVWAVFFTSFFMSLMFPTIFALGIKGLGTNTKIGASLIVMAIIGGAVFTPIMGLIAAKSMAHAMIVPLVCYVFIMFYAFIGSKPRNIVDL